MSEPLKVEFDQQVEGFTDELKNEVEDSLFELARGHKDIIGASVAADQPAHGETGHLYEARIVLYMRPENKFASEKQDTLEGALKGALDAIERQVREYREKLRETWQRPDISEPPPQ